MTKEHGFSHYEVSNYSRNEAAISRHNFAYWQGLDYIGNKGLGGRVCLFRFSNRYRTRSTWTIDGTWREEDPYFWGKRMT